MARLVILFCCLTSALGYKFFQNEVPNGDRVPHPCKANYQWPGLGHKNELGGGARNPFGLDFDAAGKTWTSELCNRDSDGDGKSNGVELGDPNCVWTKGSVPANADGLSHPGVCEPIGSAQCNGTNDWDFCTLQEFSCNATNAADVQKLTLTIDESPVPPKETTYICQHFTMPTDQDYHVIASKPVIDNVNVMHHILLFGCRAGLNYKLNSPHECGMSNGECSTQIGGWAVGGAGECLPEHLGFLIGKNSGFTHFMIQMHWNNPQELSTYKDKSGISLYITPSLRKYSSAVFVIGQMNMNIPPGRDSYEQTASCRSACTTLALNQSMYIWAANVHMHYLGREGYIDHYRNGQKIATIASTPDFSYDRPEEDTHTPPLEFKPGDEMKIRCVYKSTSRSEFTYYGDGTQDEMCFGFLGVYPASAVVNFQGCMDYDDVDLCEAAYTGFNNTVIGECHLAEHFQQLYTIGADMWVSCKEMKGECPRACKKYVEETLKKNPCRQEPAVDFFNKVFARQSQIFKQLELTTAACDQVTYGDDDDGDDPVGAASGLWARLSLFVLLPVVALVRMI